MRKFLVGSLMLLVLAVAASITANAQYCRMRSYRSSNYGYNNYNRSAGYNRGYNRGYSAPRYYNGNSGYNTGYYSTPAYYNSGTRYYATRGYSSYNGPSYYRRHRNAINIGATTGVGALIGALAGGGRGAVIGALVGAGGSTAYTYGLRPKRRYYTRYR